MLKYLTKLLIIFAFIALGSASLTAQQPDDTPATPKVPEEVPEEESVFRPEGLRLGLDVSRLVLTLTEPEARFWEVNTDLSFGRYLLSADYGNGSQKRFDDLLEYRTTGNYFRIGPDINFISENDENNALFLGVRYGYSSYEERLQTEVLTPGWDPLPINQDRQTSAYWFEGVAGLKARVWKNVFLGYTLRYKFALQVNEQEGFVSYEIPGFGRVGEGTNFAFNYHVYYRIPFRR